MSTKVKDIGKSKGTPFIKSCHGKAPLYFDGKKLRPINITSETLKTTEFNVNKTGLRSNRVVQGKSGPSSLDVEDTGVSNDAGTVSNEKEEVQVSLMTLTPSAKSQIKIKISEPPEKSPEEVAEKDEFDLKSAEGMQDYLDAASISNKRPEIIAMLQYHPFYDNSGQPTDSLEMADLRFMIQELSESNVWRVMKAIKGANPEDLHTELLGRRKQNTADLRKYLRFLKRVMWRLDRSKKVLDIKRNQWGVNRLVRRKLLKSYRKNSLAYEDTRTTLKSLFIEDLGFSQEGFDSFSNTKIYCQLLEDLYFLVTRHSPTLLDNAGSDRDTDVHPTNINKDHVSPSLDYDFRLSDLGLDSDFALKKPGYHTKFMNSFPISGDEKIKVICAAISRELSISAGIGRLEGTYLGNKFNVTDDDPFLAAIGQVGDTIVSQKIPEGSMADYASIEATGEDQSTILPFETTIVVDDDNEEITYTPGSVYLIDSIFHFGRELDTRASMLYSYNFFKSTVNATRYIEKLLVLDRNKKKGFNELLSPSEVYRSILHSLNGTMEGADSSEVKIPIAIEFLGFHIAAEHSHVKTKLLKVLLTLRDFLDTISPDEDHLVASSASVSAPSIIPPDEGVTGDSEMSSAVDALLAKNAADTESTDQVIGTIQAYVEALQAFAKDCWYHLKDGYDPGISTGAIVTSTQAVVQIKSASKLLSHLDDNLITGNSLFKTIINTARKLQEMAKKNAGGSRTFMTPDGVTNYHGLDEDALLAMLAEVFVEEISKNVRVGFSGPDAYFKNLVYYDTSANGAVRRALGDIFKYALGRNDFKTTRPRRLKKIQEREMELLQKVISENSSKVAKAFDVDYVSQITSVGDKLIAAESTIFLPRYLEIIDTLRDDQQAIFKMLATIRSVGVSVRRAVTKLRNFIKKRDEKDEEKELLVSFIKSELGRRILRNLSRQQISLAEITYDRLKPMSSTSMLPYNFNVSYNTYKVMSDFLKDPKMNGSKGHNIRVMAVGIPSGMIKVFNNPPVTMSSKKFENPVEPNTLVKINVYRRDLEMDDIIFKPKTYVFDASLYMARFPFSHALHGNKSKTMGDLILNTKFKKMPTAVSTRKIGGWSYVKGEKLLGFEPYSTMTNADPLDLMFNHIISEFMKNYYKLMFGLDFDESTFCENDMINDLLVDSDASVILAAAQQDEKTKSLITCGAVDVNDLLEEVNVFDEKFKRVRPFKEVVHLTLPEPNPSVINDESGETVLPAILTEEGHRNFRALCASGLFNSTALNERVLSPKYFDRVFMLPIDPDDFEINVSKTFASLKGSRTMKSKQFFSMAIKEKDSEGNTVWKLKPRRKNEHMYSFSDFFVQVETLDELGEDLTDEEDEA